VLKANGIRTLSPDFNFFQIVQMLEKDGDVNPVTTVRGDKLLTHNGNAEINGGLLATLPPQKTDFASALQLEKKHSFENNERTAIMVSGIQYFNLWCLL
jgi:hypothetical protein